MYSQIDSDYTEILYTGSLGRLNGPKDLAIGYEVFNIVDVETWNNYYHKGDGKIQVWLELYKSSTQIKGRTVSWTTASCSPGCYNYEENKNIELDEGNVNWSIDGDNSYYYLKLRIRYYVEMEVTQVGPYVYLIYSRLNEDPLYNTQNSNAFASVSISTGSGGGGGGCPPGWPFC